MKMVFILLNMSKLPSEILNIVYSHLSSKDVLQCILTCKRWKESALPFFYNGLSVNFYRAFQTKKLLRMNNTERDRYFQYGVFTKTLQIHQDIAGYLPHYLGDTLSLKDTDGEYTKEEWIMLLRYLPNIQVLNLVYSRNTSKYIQYILESTDTDKILLNIKAILLGARQETNNSTSTYHAVCYKYRTTITNLEVEHNTSILTNSKLPTLLSHFNSLTLLKFNNSYDPQLTIFDILDTCPHTITLNYTTEFAIPDSTINRIKLNSCFKELILSIPAIPKHYITCLSDDLIPHLDILTLDISNTDVFDWVESIGLNNAVKFLDRLSTVKTAFIRWKPDRNSDRQTTSTESDHTIMFALLNAMKRSKKMYYQVHYSNCVIVHKSFKLTSDDSLQFDYGLKLSEYHLPLTNQDSEQEWHDDGPLSHGIQTELHNPSTSTIGLEVFHYMRVVMCDNDPNLPLNFLRYALMNCPNLQQFSFTAYNKSALGICIGNDTKTGIKNIRERRDLSSTTQENIKIVKISNMVPSKILLELMVKYMPATEVFLCGATNDADSPTVLFEADLTAFSHLDLVQLDFQLLSGKKQKTVYLEIQFPEKDREYYCLVKDFPKLNVTKTTLEQISSRENGNIRKAIVKCRNHVKIAVCYSCSLFKIISDGEISELDYKQSSHMRFQFI
ncbi:uncharacterized protein EV154DRAFT_496804 [Mucor mucedo]|uniref:uncharacterized protein n=1 Tax=Mucor mucedo TaxID=29922 RepID=UPI0022201317|nr:uncharacterized protein EV154DRAFT_496804 [Mucor mucedo]KAI7895051.1 hypothetical protein EV154DRAFT_496804 [Mucor mucedo]